jgi:uncharacterized protein
MLIDCFAHICPQRFIDEFAKRGVPWEALDRSAPKVGGPALWDVAKRLEVMDQYEGYVQILSPNIDNAEIFFGPQDTPYLARVCNDAIAEVVSKYPNKFVGAVATIPMNNIEAALKEIDRVINELGFKGILMHTPVFVHEEGWTPEMGINYETMKPLDLPEFMPIYEAMSHYNRPIWIHPFGKGGVPVYPGESRGKYMLYLPIGWPLESAVAMSRLVCSGVLAKYPNLKFMIHHCGSGIIPVLGERLADEFDKFVKVGALKLDQPGGEDPFKNKRVIDYYKMFYADTALDGSSIALECGHSFFGAEHIVFGTDFPFDTANGARVIQMAVNAVNGMRIPETEKQLIFEGNARRIMNLNL